MLSYLDVIILTLLGRVAGQAGGAPDCPCIEWASLDKYIVGDLSTGHLVYAPSGPSGPQYKYPVNYGNALCKQHDLGLEPMCSRATPPSWCNQKWCYVDKDKCTLANIKTQFFADAPTPLFFSYETCTGAGGANSFTRLMESSPDTAMAELIKVMTINLETVQEQIEDSYAGIKGDALEQCNIPGMCPCTTCQSHAPWNGKQVDFSEISASLAIKGDRAKINEASCLAKATADPYRKVAAVESDAQGTRVGYQYGADQITGTYVQWPAMVWCPRKSESGRETGWDPRLRPWYAAAATGPKDVVIVVDVSGSMKTNDRYITAREATVAALDTLSWRDFASIVLFDNDVDSGKVFSDVMYPVTESERAKMSSWARSRISPQGGTSFTAGLWKALKIIQRSVDEGKSAMCEKAILFLTDGQDNSWAESDYGHVKSECSKRGTTLFTYALGSGADTTITKRLACENNGVFYKVPDGGDLPSIMAGYYAYFAAGTETCEPAWSKYRDPTSGETLYAGCLSIMDRTEKNPALLGATCMDANMVADANTLRGNPKWQDFVCSVSDTSKKCRANYLQECHKERIRKAYSDSSVCAFNAEAVSLTCGCIDPSCADDENFVDSKGYFCDTWVGDGCEATVMRQFKYGDSEAATIRQKCVKSCGLCQWLDSSQCTSRSNCKKSSGPQCRPCTGAKVSGNNIDGRKHCCSKDGHVCPEADASNPDASGSNEIAGFSATLALVMALTMLLEQ